MNLKPLLIASAIMTLALIALSFSPTDDPTGLAPCPGCKVIPQPSTPDHSLLLLSLGLGVALMGAHSLHHHSNHRTSRLLLIGLFLFGFIILSAVFSLRLASPNSAITTVAQQGASIFAAVGILALFTLAAFELGRFYEAKKQYPEELQEDEWDTEKPDSQNSPPN